MMVQSEYSTVDTNGALREIVLSLLRKIFMHVFNLITMGNSTDGELGASEDVEPRCL